MPNHVYLLFEIPKPSKLVSSDLVNEKVIPVQTVIYEGVRSNELHSDEAFSSHLSIENLLPRDMPAEAVQSANQGGRAAFDLLRKDGYIKRIIQTHTSLPKSAKNHHGFSSDLAFALAFIVSYLKQDTTLTIAATGCLSSEGAVLPVGYAEEKLRVAVEKLPIDSLIFLPEDNRKDICATLMDSCQQKGIKLHYIQHLEEACDALDINISHFYRSNPFRGLDYFGFEHSLLFFGRDSDIDNALLQFDKRKQENCPSLLVLGLSGTGKSSFIRAGLLPEMVKGSTTSDNQTVIFSVFTPRQLTKENCLYIEGSGYSDRLCLTLTEHWSKQLNLKVDAGFSDTAGAIQCLLQALKKYAELKNTNTCTYIWVIDQLEELFTLDWNKHEQNHFIELITQLPSYGICILAAMRSDFYPDYQKNSSLFSHFHDSGQYDLLLPDSTSLRSIINEPARLAELSFEERNGVRLDERILSDMDHQPSALPLLQLVLSQLYLQRDKGTKQLTFHSYENIGAVSGAMTTWAQKVYNSLPKSEVEYFPFLIRRLVVIHSENIDGYLLSSRSVRLKDFPNKVLPLLENLEKSRLLVRDEDSKGNLLIKVTHEVILNNWNLIQDLVKKNKQNMTLLHQLDQSYTRYRIIDSPQKKASLLQGNILKQALKLKKEFGKEIPESIGAYIALSHRQRKRSEHRGILIFSLVLTSFIFSIWGGFYKETSKYYQSIDRSYIEPKALGEMTTSQHKKNENHYKISYKGWFGKIMKIQSVNQFDQCPAVKEKGLKTWVGTHERNECDCNVNICTLSFEYGSNNQLILEKGYRNNNDLLYSIGYSHKSGNNSSIKGRYIDSTEMQPKSDARVVLFEVGVDDRITSVKFEADNDNNPNTPTFNEELLNEKKYEYTHTNQIIESFYSLDFNKDNTDPFCRLINDEKMPTEPILHGQQGQSTVRGISADGTSGLIRRFSTEGHEIETYFLNKNGEYINNKKNNSGKIKRSYDDNGSLKSITFYEVKGKSSKISVGKIIKYNKKFDTRRFTVNKDYFSLDKNDVEVRQLHNNNFHRETITFYYDDKGRVSLRTIAYYDEFMEPIEADPNGIGGKYFFTKIEYLYHPDQSHDELQFYYDNRKMKTLVNNFHLTKREYNNKGDLVKSSYFGKRHNEKVEAKGGVHSYTFTYERGDRGYINLVTLYNKEDQLLSNFDYQKHSTLSFQYDNKGNAVHSIGKKNKGNISFIRKKVFDPYNNYLSKSFFGEKSKRQPIHICEPNKKSIVWLECRRYNEAHNEIERHYYDVNGHFAKEKNNIFENSGFRAFAIRRQYYTTPYSHKPGCIVYWDETGALLGNDGDCSPVQKKLPDRLRRNITTSVLGSN